MEIYIDHRVMNSDAADVGIFCTKIGLFNSGVGILEKTSQNLGKKNLYIPLEWYYYRGLCYLFLGNYSQAKQCLDICVENKFGMPLSAHYLAISLLMLKKIDKAKKITSETIKIYSDFFPGWYLFGQINESNGDFKEATVCFEKSISLCPGSKLAHKKWDICKTKN